MSISGWEVPTNSSKIEPPWNVMIPQYLSFYLSIYQFIFSQMHIIGNIDRTPSHWASLFSWIIYALNFHHLFHAVNFFSLFREVNFIQWCDCQHHHEQKPLIITWTSILCFGNLRLLLLQMWDENNRYMYHQWRLKMVCKTGCTVLYDINLFWHKLVNYGKFHCFLPL